MQYEELSIEIVDHREQKLRTKIVTLVKVIRKNHSVEEAT